MTLLLLLSCHKKAIHHAEALAATCAWTSSARAPTVELVTLDREPLPTPLAVLVEVRQAEVLVDGAPVVDPYDVLLERAEEAKRAAIMTGREELGFSGQIALGVDRGAPLGLVAETLQDSWAAGYQTVHVVAFSPQAVDVPPPPRPAYAEEMRARLAATPPEERQLLVVEELERQFERCGPAQEVFEAVAYASPETKCQILWEGMPDALRRCPGVPAGKAMTLLHLIQVPEALTTSWTVTLDPAQPRVVPEDEPFESLAPWLFDQERVWLTTSPEPAR